MSNPYATRLRKVKRLIAEQNGSAALVLSAATEKNFSYDLPFPYRQNSDFFYLTGSLVAGQALLISTELKKPILFSTKRSELQILWDGPIASPRALAKNLGAELVVCDNPATAISSHLRGVEHLYFQNETDSISEKVARKCLKVPSGKRRNVPTSFHFADEVLASFRLYKDRSEIAKIKQAAKITSDALLEALPLIRPGTSERKIRASLLEYFDSNNCHYAFDPIVATGVSGATVHYVDLKRTLKKGQLLLIDWGASHQMYCADISRVLPVSGSFDKMQRKLYDVVLKAQKDAIRRAGPGVSFRSVHETAAKSITKGLKKIGVLRGDLPDLMKRKAHSKYFPYGVGHSLGIDTHDPTGLKAGPESTLRSGVTLEPGMVITIEPGIHFPKQFRKIAPCGIRIEDDILITKTGTKVLSPDFPKEIDEIEDLMNC